MGGQRRGARIVRTGAGGTDFGGAGLSNGAGWRLKLTTLELRLNSH